ncbi:MAG: hypothetical protein ACP5U1_06780 [Desulfomonilaceae bacterium]
MEKTRKKRQRRDVELLKQARDTKCQKNDIFCIDWLLVGAGPII